MYVVQKKKKKKKKKHKGKLSTNAIKIVKIIFTNCKFPENRPRNFKVARNTV